MSDALATAHPLTQEIVALIGDLALSEIAWIDGRVRAALSAQSDSVQCREDVARILLLLMQARYVLRDLHGKHPDCGYLKMAEGCAAAHDALLALSKPAGQPVEGWLGDVRKALSDYNADLADSEHNPDAPGDFAIAALKKIERALSPAPASPQRREKS